MSNILHAGIQRSGTNFLCSIIKNNFSKNVVNDNPIIGRNSPLHKHFRIQDNKDTICMDEKYYNEFHFIKYDDYKSNLGFQDLKTIVIYKDPVNWLQSILKWGIKCNWIRSKKEFKGVWKDWLSEYSAYYNKWHNWSEQSDDIYMLQYESLILDFENQTNKISQFLKAELLKRFKPLKVDHSVTRTSFNLYFDIQNTQFSAETVKKIYLNNDITIERVMYEL